MGRFKDQQEQENSSNITEENPREISDRGNLESTRELEKGVKERRSRVGDTWIVLQKHLALFSTFIPFIYSSHGNGTHEISRWINKF